MSTAITFTFGTADPGCCVRTCQDILDLVESKLSGSLPDNLHGIIISHTTPAVDDRDKLWIKTTNAKNCEFVGMLIWCEEGTAWVDFTFDPATITPGDDCTFLGTKDGEVKHRTLSQLIDCLEEKHIPCSKIDFGTVAPGCSFVKWTLEVESNAAAVEAGRIEFDLAWTSATCGNGRKFVTYSPVVGGARYIVEACMPSDAAGITVTNILGLEIGAWINTATTCVPDDCGTSTGLPVVLTRTAALPTPAGNATEFSWDHGLPGKPHSVTLSAVNVTGESGYVPGDTINLLNVNTTDADQVYAAKWDIYRIKVWALKVAGDTTPTMVIGDYDATGNHEGTFTPSKWQLEVTLIYNAT